MAGCGSEGNRGVNPGREVWGGDGRVSYMEEECGSAHLEVRCEGVRCRSAHLEVRCEGVRQPHVPGEGAEDEVAHLNARRGDGVAEPVVVLAEELGEVVEQHQQQS